jgi:hypothetical protein
MKKRAAISMETVVVAAIVLFVLVVVIAIFGSQIKDFAAGFTSISNTTKGIREGTVCKGFMSNKNCQDTCGETDNFYYEEIPAPSGGWGDCPDETLCCERIKKDE